MSKEDGVKAKVFITEDNYKQIVEEELDKKGSKGIFMWSVFLLCALPNILNGFHVASYTLLGHLPDDQWCGVDDLRETSWTLEEKRKIAERDLGSHGCSVYDWDYKHLSKMSFDEAFNYTNNLLKANATKEISCKVKGKHEFQEPESTFVADWDLTCERSIQRTSAQLFISLGKFFGSFSFGIFSDKFGRKSSFTLGAAFFIVSSFFCTFSPWYPLFLVGRFGLGSASSGLFYPAFTMIVENICLKHRSWMSIAFSASYPIGMIMLAIAGYLIVPWRYLQFALTVPALLLILNCYLMSESPRWLIANKKYDRAYKILFKKDSHYEVQKNNVIETIIEKKPVESSPSKASMWQSIREGPLKQIINLFATWKMRKLILTSYFMFCVTSLSYYVTALNAANLHVSRFLYVAVTGIVDIPSYLVPVVMLRFTGRRVTTMFLFFLTGVSLLLVLSIPKENTTGIISLAMMGRFGISATYSIVTLYTAELYPTEVRNSALGTCSTWAHVGSISAPYVVDVLGALGWFIPTTLCGICVIIAGLLTLLLPETSKQKLADNVKEDE